MEHDGRDGLVRGRVLELHVDRAIRPNALRRDDVSAGDDMAVQAEHATARRPLAELPADPDLPGAVLIRDGGLVHDGQSAPEPAPFQDSVTVKCPSTAVFATTTPASALSTDAEFDGGVVGGQ